MAVGVKSVPALCTRLEEFSIPFTQSKSGRAAVFFRDPGTHDPDLAVPMIEAWYFRSRCQSV
jgi:hypothetical protein